MNRKKNNFIMRFLMQLFISDFTMLLLIKIKLNIMTLLGNPWIYHHSKNIKNILR